MLEISARAVDPFFKNTALGIKAMNNRCELKIQHTRDIGEFYLNAALMDGHMSIATQKQKT